MTKACTEGGLLLLSASSIKPGVWHDPACILEPGCHGFIRRPSFILYAKAARLQMRGLIRCVEGWVYTPRGRLDDAIFARVCEGVDSSAHIPRWARTYFAENRP